MLLMFTQILTTGQENTLGELPIFTDENWIDIGLVAEFQAPQNNDIDWIRSLALNNTDDFLAVGKESGSIDLYDLQNFNQVVSFTKHSQSVVSLVFSEANETILASGSLDTSVMIWNVDELELSLTIQYDFRSILDMAFHPSLDVIAFSVSAGVLYPSDNAVVLWDIQQNDEIALFEGHEGQVTAVEYSPDGNTLISGDSLGTIIIWDLNTYTQIQSIDAHELQINDLAYNSDGSAFASVGRDGTLTIWDSNDFSSIVSMTDQDIRLTTVKYDRLNGSYLIVGASTGEVMVLASTTLSEIVRFQAHDLPISDLAYSHNNNFIVTGSTDGNVRIWGIVQEE
jgi:WD40 repeat protein